MANLHPDMQELANLMTDTMTNLIEASIAMTSVLFAIKELKNDKFNITQLDKKAIDERIANRLAPLKVAPPISIVVRIVEEETNAECMKLLAESRK